MNCEGKKTQCNKCTNLLLIWSDDTQLLHTLHSCVCCFPHLFIHTVIYWRLSEHWVPVMIQHWSSKCSSVQQVDVLLFIDNVCLLILQMIAAIRRPWSQGIVVVAVLEFHSTCLLNMVKQQRYVYKLCHKFQIDIFPFVPTGPLCPCQRFS